MILQRQFHTGIVALNYAEVPTSNPPLVLLHGGSASWQSFAALMPELAVRWHLYAVDLRGHGRSGRVPRQYRLHDYADDVSAFIVRTVGGPATIYGHSLGGIVALMVAAHAPELVRAVVVGDAPLTADTWIAELQRDRRMLEGWRRLAGGTRPLTEVIAGLKEIPIHWPADAPLRPAREALGEDAPWFVWMAESLERLDPDMLSALVEDVETTAAGYDMEVYMPQIRCPVLLVQADATAGGLMTDAEVARAQKLLGQARHIFFPHVSHGLEDTARLLDAIASVEGG